MLAGQDPPATPAEIEKLRSAGFAEPGAAANERRELPRAAPQRIRRPVLGRSAGCKKESRKELNQKFH